MNLTRNGLPKHYPCAVCGEMRDLLISKKDKPYLVCNPCGVQVFIRGEVGISLLKKIVLNTILIEKLARSGKGYFELSTAVRLKHRINLTKSELKESEDKKPIFGGENIGRKTRRISLGKKLAELTKEYDQYIQKL